MFCFMYFCRAENISNKFISLKRWTFCRRLDYFVEISNYFMGLLWSDFTATVTTWKDPAWKTKWPNKNTACDWVNKHCVINVSKNNKNSLTFTIRIQDFTPLKQNDKLFWNWSKRKSKAKQFCCWPIKALVFWYAVGMRQICDKC